MLDPLTTQSPACEIGKGRRSLNTFAVRSGILCQLFSGTTFKVVPGRLISNSSLGSRSMLSLKVCRPRERWTSEHRLPVSCDLPLGHSRAAPFPVGLLGKFISSCLNDIFYFQLSPLLTHLTFSVSLAVLLRSVETEALGV